MDTTRGERKRAGRNETVNEREREREREKPEKEETKKGGEGQVPRRELMRTCDRYLIFDFILSFLICLVPFFFPV